MLGRAVLVLCVLTGVAAGCPIRFNSPQEQAQFMALHAHEIEQNRAAAQMRAAYGSDELQGISVAVLFMSFCGIALAITRANAVRRTFATSRRLVEADLDVMKNVAQLQRKRAVFWVVASAVFVAGIGSLPLAFGPKLVLLTTSTMLFGAAAVAFSRIELVLGLRSEPSLRVLSHGEFLFVARGKRLVGWVAAPPRIVAAASHLPVAKLRT
jgi:hypothetical protein